MYRVREVYRCERRPVIGLLAAMLVVLTTGVAMAGTLTGASGLIQVPAADVLEVKEADLTFRYTDDRLGASFTYGVLDQVEIGVNTVNQGPDPARIGILFKGVVFPETAREPGLAVGLETDQSYIVASKRLAPRLRGHVGFGYGDLRGVFGGVAYAFNTASVSSSAARAPATTLMAEYTPSGANVGVRMVFTPLISVDVSLLDLDEVTAGISMRTNF